MNKKMIFVVLMALSTIIYAINAEEKKKQEQENMKLLAQMGLPLPGSGIRIVPRAQLNLPEELIETGKKDEEESRAKGYVTRYNNYPRELLNITEDRVAKEIKESLAKLNDTYTGFRKNTDELKLAFKFPSLSKNNHLFNYAPEIHMLAAVPKGGFHPELGGWSGAIEYFNYKYIGTCAYGVTNVMASNAAIKLAQEDVTYIINDKATILPPVEGNENSGFIYSVKWYDNENYHDLTCANLKFSNEIYDAVVELAIEIDKTKF